MSGLRLHRVYYPVTALGYGQRLGVWVQGCARLCPGCLSPEMQPPTGPAVAVADLLAALPGDFCPDGLTVSGGEPFDQPDGLAELVERFGARYTTDILVYTGYTLAQLRARRDPAVDRVLGGIAALADGPYVEAQNRGAGLMGSANQRLYVFAWPERYRDFCRAERKIQCVQERDRLLCIGIPPKPAKGE